MANVGALSTARSGLINSGAALAVVGNNIANQATVGFKAARTEFVDLLSAEGGGEVGKIGLGSRVGAVRSLFGQGPVESTGRPLDMSIDGQGFFVLRDNSGRVFTRAGNFQLQPDGTVTNLEGQPLQGFRVDSTGAIASGMTDVAIAGINSQASPTGQIVLRGNLNAADALKNGGVFDGTSFQTAYNSTNHPTSVEIFDSLGAQHQLSIFFTKSTAAPGQWQVNIGVDAGETGGTPGALNLLSTSTLTFDPQGAVTSGGTVAFNVTFAGAASQAISLDLSGMAQFAASSGENFVSQDGFAAGGLVGLAVDEEGIISGTFDNGQTRPLFQLAVARFPAPEGLLSGGNAVYRETVDSGPAAIATAKTQGNGSIVASALEQSNVQIAQEFINLISSQRAFQANARVITASDTLMGDLVNIVR
jgi:flagellar hook protein FlgE